MASRPTNWRRCSTICSPSPRPRRWCFRNGRGPTTSSSAASKRVGCGYVSFHGGVPSDKRPALVERFRDDPACRVFLSTDAGSTGLNLQHASTLVNMDLPWNPAILEQRIARIHRMGQKRPVQVINFVAKGTIEEGMLSVLAFKRSLSAGILDGGSGEISLGGSRLNRFMKDVENVTGRMGEGEAVTPAEEVGNIVTADDAGSAEDTNADANDRRRRDGDAQADGAGAPPRDAGPIRGKPWRRSARSSLPLWRPPTIPALRRIHGSSAIRRPARKTSKCRCRRRKPRDNLPMRFPRSRTACGARWRDRRQQLNDDWHSRRIGDHSPTARSGQRR